MNRIVRGLLSYIVYPVCFAAAGTIVIKFGVKPAFEAMDAKLCMQVVNGAPDITMDYELESYNVSDTANDENEGNASDGEQAESGKSETNDVPVTKPGYGTQYGTIFCKEAGVKAPLYYGDTDEILRLGAGQYEKSSLPGTKGTSIIGGHDTTFFAGLEQAKVGQEIILTTNYGEFTYEITQIKVAKATDESAYDLQSDMEQVILYTCYPFGVTTYEREDRYYVYCKRKAE
ncbi:MAG: class D sortase [Lachnospiraceae bacterium]|nr:class D sortase [Lachnospiraceae bacterium]